MHQTDNPSSIVVTESIGEWFVRTIEGNASRIHTFEREVFALAFADEERVRLGIDSICVTDRDSVDCL